MKRLGESGPSASQLLEWLLRLGGVALVCDLALVSPSHRLLAVLWRARGGGGPVPGPVDYTLTRSGGMFQWPRPGLQFLAGPRRLMPTSPGRRPARVPILTQGQFFAGAFPWGDTQPMPDGPGELNGADFSGALTARP